MGKAHTIALESGFMVVEVSGEGEPALLLHGIPGHRATFGPLVEHLSADFQLVVPDLLGFGESSPYAGDGHIEEQSSAVLAICTALRLSRLHLVGFDFGGPIAVRVAERAPSLVRSLALLATNTFTDTPVPGPLKLARVPLVGDWFFRLAFSRWGLEQLWGPAVGDKRALTRAHFRQALGPAQGITSTRRIFLHSLRHLSELYAGVEAALPNIRAARLVLWGDRDPFFAVDVGRRTARALSQAPFELLQGCGHFLPLERPAEVADILRRFWRSGI